MPDKGFDAYPLNRSFYEVAPEFGWNPDYVRHSHPSGIGPLGCR